MKKKIRLDSIKSNERNPRRIMETEFNRLCESIKRDPQFMELRPIVIDSDGMILGGNMRYRACKHLGMEEIPESWVKKAEDLTPEQRKRFILIDNAPEGMTGEWDFDILSKDWEIAELNDPGFEKLLHGILIPASNKPIDEEAMKNTSNACPKCGFKW
jgi:hypothetical protein